jgi:hypothetical protein
MVRGFKRTGLHGFEEEPVAVRKGYQAGSKVRAFGPRVRLKGALEVGEAKLAWQQRVDTLFDLKPSQTSGLHASLFLWAKKFETQNETKTKKNLFSTFCFFLGSRNGTLN